VLVIGGNPDKASSWVTRALKRQTDNSMRGFIKGRRRPLRSDGDDLGFRSTLATDQVTEPRSGRNL